VLLLLLLLSLGVAAFLLLQFKHQTRVVTRINHRHAPVVPVCYYACSARRALSRAVIVPLLLLLRLCGVAFAKVVFH
jgi:hypothetical protein